MILKPEWYNRNRYIFSLDNLLSDNETRNGYSIQISEECFHHWKRTKEELNFRDDEDLIYHLMNLKRRTLSVTLE